MRKIAQMQYIYIYKLCRRGLAEEKKVGIPAGLTGFTFSPPFHSRKQDSEHLPLMLHRFSLLPNQIRIPELFIVTGRLSPPPLLRSEPKAVMALSVGKKPPAHRNIPSSSARCHLPLAFFLNHVSFSLPKDIGRKVASNL